MYCWCAYWGRGAVMMYSSIPHPKPEMVVTIVLPTSLSIFMYPYKTTGAIPTCATINISLIKGPFTVDKGVPRVI